MKVAIYYLTLYTIYCQPIISIYENDTLFYEMAEPLNVTKHNEVNIAITSLEDSNNTGVPETNSLMQMPELENSTGTFTDSKRLSGTAATIPLHQFQLLENGNLTFNNNDEAWTDSIRLNSTNVQMLAANGNHTFSDTDEANETFIAWTIPGTFTGTDIYEKDLEQQNISNFYNDSVDNTTELLAMNEDETYDKISTWNVSTYNLIYFTTKENVETTELIETSTTSKTEDTTINETISNSKIFIKSEFSATKNNSVNFTEMEHESLPNYANSNEEFDVSDPPNSTISTVKSILVSKCPNDQGFLPITNEFRAELTEEPKMSNILEAFQTRLQLYFPKQACNLVATTKTANYIKWIDLNLNTSTLCDLRDNNFNILNIVKKDEFRLHFYPEFKIGSVTWKRKITCNDLSVNSRMKLKVSEIAIYLLGTLLMISVVFAGVAFFKGKFHKSHVITGAQTPDSYQRYTLRGRKPVLLSPEMPKYMSTAVSNPAYVEDETIEPKAKHFVED